MSNVEVKVAEWGRTAPSASSSRRAVMVMAVEWMKKTAIIGNDNNNIYIINLYILVLLYGREIYTVYHR